MNEPMMNFRQAYEFPLTYNKKWGFMVTSEKNFTVRAFDWLQELYDFFGKMDSYHVSESEKSLIVDHLNSGEPLRMFQYVGVSPGDPSVIQVDGVDFICMRGWGHLVGVGGLHLDSKVAAKLQDEFRDYIISILKK